MKVVLDTNVVVSGLLSPGGPPAAVLRTVLAGVATICFDERILSEYRGVLARRKFGFDAERVAFVLGFFDTNGQSVVAPPLGLGLPDLSDEAFVEVAVATAADCLVTGNLKHFPAERLRGARAVSPRSFCQLLASQSAPPAM